jgi:uncharacterized repeat protein (TIGR02543 family)
MKKRALSLLLCFVMVLSLLPVFECPASAADTDEKNISNTSADTFTTLGFNTDTGEVAADASSGKSPTGLGSFAIRTVPELLVSGNAWDLGLYDYGATIPGMNFNKIVDDDEYMRNLRTVTSPTAYLTGLPADYSFVKTLAFDPTGSGKDDYVAYLCGKNHYASDADWKPNASCSVYSLYVTDKNGHVSAQYGLGTAPFVLLTHQADAYLPLAAGDYDGDGEDELAVYCFGDSSAAKQWGSTTAPYYKTDAAGNAVDNQYRRINDDGYLIDAATGLRIDASEHLIDADGYLVDADGNYIDNNGTIVTEQNRVVGTPVLGEPVGYKTVAYDDKNLDVRVLDVGVTKDSDTVTDIAVTRAKRGAAGSMNIDIEYDLTNLGFSKLNASDDNAEELANKKLYPIVDLSTVEQPGDEYDDLVLCVSRANYSVKTAAEAATRTVFWVDPGSSTGAKTQTMSGVWYHRADYGNSASAAYSAEMMAFGGASEANLDGDADGVKEVVVAGYRYNNTNTTVSLSSLTDGPSGDDNPFKMDDSNDNISYYLAATYSYNAASKSYASDGPATWVEVDDGVYHDSTNMRENIYDENTLRDVVYAPMEVLGFAEKGAGYADSVFINSFVCDYYLNDGSVSTLPYGPWDDLKNCAYSKREGKFLFVSYAVPTNYVLVKNDSSRDGKYDTEQRWIGDAVAGNFDGDASGVEELYFTYVRNTGKDGYNPINLTLMAVQKKTPGKLSNASDLYDGSLKINVDSSIYNEYDTDQSTFYSFTATELLTEDGGCYAFCAPNWDDDSVIARPSSVKEPEYYFSDPNVIAVLQSAPYFEELSADYDFYPSNGSTSIEKETGTTHSGSAGFEVSAGLILGMKAEIKPFGIPIGETEVKNTVTASLSTEYSHETTQSYSTAFTAMVGTDMVALTMTPYVRYYYDVYDPGKGWMPAEMTIDMPKTPRTTMTSVETYDRVADYSGWERIRGNILSSTPGDPHSYATTSSGLSSFEGGKTTMGSSGNNWVGVGTGGTSSVGNITQTISSEKTDGFSVSVGLNFEYEATATVFGATAGFTASAGVTAGYGYASFTGMSFSGTVDNLPQDAASGYDFLCRFGCWKDSLRYTTSSGKTDSNSLYVLGYLVKDVESLPKPPQDLAVVDFTENSITLEWSHPDPVPVSYILYRKEAGGLVPLQIVRADASGGKTAQQYTDTTCEPGTEYSYVIVAVRYVNGFETRGPNSPTATGKTLGSNVPKVKITPLLPVAQSGDDVTLTAEVTPVEGGGAPSVQWQKWNGSSYVNLNGESGLTYKMLKVTDELSGSRYRCYVTQMVSGRWMVGYSVFSELTVTKRASATTLGPVNTSYAAGGTVDLSASVADKDTSDAITDGSVVFSIVNTSTGDIWNLKSTLGTGGAVSNSFKPTAEGVYTVSARYLGTKVYAGSKSAEQTFTVYSEDGEVLVIDSASELTYGDTLPLAAQLVDSNGGETPVPATYKVTDGTTFDSQTTSVVVSDSTFNPIAASNALYFARNGQTRGYNDACGNYILQATYTDPESGTTYYATKLVTVKPRNLDIGIGSKTIKNFSTATLDGSYLSDVPLTYDAFAGADTAFVDSYKKLFGVYTDTPYKELYVGDQAIRLRYKDAAASGLGSNYEPTLAQLLANYNVRYSAGVLSVTDDWYTVTYSVDAGQGSLDARTASRATLASNTKVLRGTPLTFAAAPAVGYEVGNWNVDGSKLTSDASLLPAGNTASSKSGAITEDTIVAVTFGIYYPALSWSVTDGHGGLTPSVNATSPANVPATGTYTFTAKPDSGYMVKEWRINKEVKKNADGSTYQGKTLTVSDLGGDTAVTVEYTKSITYTVSASGMDSTGAALGSVTVSPGTGSLLAGTALTFTANAPDGYIIKEWRQYTGATNYTVLQYNVPTYSVASLTADTDIRAVFMQEVKYKLSFGVNNMNMGGIIAKNAGTTLTSDSPYFAGIPVTFTVTPFDGYRIQSVTTDDALLPTLTPVTTAANGEKTYTLTLSRAVTVTATLADAGAKHTVTVVSGTVGGSNTGFYKGDLVTITADAAPAGKVFSRWTSADGVTFANAASAATSFTMPDKAVTVTASYTDAGGGGGGGGTAEYTLKFETNGGRAVGSVTASKDAAIDLAAYTSSKAGYVFAGWCSDSALTKPVTSVTLTGSVTVYAKWTAVSIRHLNTEDHVAYLAGYSSGAFRPGRNMTRAEAAMMFYRLLLDKTAGETKRFPDVDTGAWYGEAVEKLAGLEIITGYSDGAFRPKNRITRAEFVAIATRFTTMSQADCSFSDVSTSHWAYRYIAFAFGQGWISGYSDGSFRPADNITRAEVAKIVNRMLGRTADTAYIDGHSVKTFSDVPKTHWAYYDITEAANAHGYTKDAADAESWTGLK